MSKVTMGEIQGDWRRLLALLGAHSATFPHLEPLRVQLTVQLDRVAEIDDQQTSLTANRQEISKQLWMMIAEGQRLARLLRSAIRQHYDHRAEQVAGFGVQPIRGKTRKAKPIPHPSTPLLTVPARPQP